VVGLVGEPRTVFEDDPSARFVAAAVTETLVRRDEHDELVPRLAESVPTIENGGLRVVTDDAAASDGRLVATFRLREARWQDGQPITASDVRFAWEQDELAPAGTIVRWMADRIASVEVLSARDFRVLYRNGERWDDYALAPRVLPSHRLAQATAAQRAAYAREPVHAGPFAIAAWLPGSITLSAFKDYVLGPPKLGRLEIHFFSTRAAALQALLKGDIDVAPWPVLEADLAKTLDRFADGTRLLAHYVPTEAMTVPSGSATLSCEKPSSSPSTANRSSMTFSSDGRVYPRPFSFRPIGRPPRRPWRARLRIAIGRAPCWLTLALSKASSGSSSVRTSA